MRWELSLIRFGCPWTRSLWAVLLFVTTFGGTCIPNAYSPPATLGPLERPGGAAPGQPTVGAYVAPAGVHPRKLLGDYGANLISGGAFARQSMRERPVIFSESFNVIRVRGQSPEHVHQSAYTLRVGASRTFELGRPRRYETLFSIHGGLGGGYSRVGSFAAPDLGMTLGWKGKYVIPFFATVDAGVSSPFRTMAFQVGNVGPDYTGTRETDVVARELLASQWYRVSPGVAVRLGNWRHGVPMATLAGQVAMGQIFSSQSSDVFVAGIFSVDVQFAGPRADAIALR
jgi:hypothetical protein